MVDICRCMVGAWPSHVDLNDRDTKKNEPIQPVIDGTPQHFTASSAGTPESSQEPPGDDGGDSAIPVDGAAAPNQQGLCSAVVFRGQLGGDRAVRANLPFPWMENLDEVTMVICPGDELPQYCVVPNDSSILAFKLEYPTAFLSNVKYGAPFSTLWPGHTPSRATDANINCPPRSPEETNDDGNGGSDGDSGPDGENEHRSHRRSELERLPSSGPDPFFHAGYTAYFEITLGEPVEPLLQAFAGNEDPCVAIGLALHGFPLK